jgi:carbonic anhydrase
MFLHLALLLQILLGLAAICHATPTPDPYPELTALATGNEEYVKTMNSHHHGLLQGLAQNGQHPPIVIFDCSDSRVSEPLIFSSLPGDMFKSGNIANQVLESDFNSLSVLSYAVEHLHVKHVIVMGHYGCGGVQAAILSPPPLPWGPAAQAIEGWILPIRQLYQTSTRPAIVEYREKQPLGGHSAAPALDLHEPAFRALIEENVKSNVQRIASSQVLKEHYEKHPDEAVFIHGLVYDIETGRAYDLRISTGPPGKPVPTVPLEPVAEG